MTTGLDANQNMAIRLFRLVHRREPSDNELAAIRERGSNFQKFRIAFLMEWLNVDAREKLKARFKECAESALRHESEVTRLIFEEIQARIDSFHSLLLDLLRHSDRINLAFTEYGKLQTEVLKLARRLETEDIQSREPEEAEQKPLSNSKEAFRR